MRNRTERHGEGAGQAGAARFDVSQAPPGSGVAFSPPPSPPPAAAPPPPSAPPPSRRGMDGRQKVLLAGGVILLALVVAGGFFAIGYFAGGGGGQRGLLRGLAGGGGLAQNGASGQNGTGGQAGTGPLAQYRQMLASGEASLLRGTVVSVQDGLLTLNGAQGQQQVSVTDTTRVLQRSAARGQAGGQARGQLAQGDAVLVLARNKAGGSREALVVLVGQQMQPGAGGPGAGSQGQSPQGGVI